MATLLKCVGKSGKIPSRESMMIEDISRKVLESCLCPRNCIDIIDKHKKELKKRKVKRESSLAYFLRSCCYDVTNIPDFVAFNSLFEELLKFYRVAVPGHFDTDIGTCNENRDNEINDRKRHSDNRKSHTDIRKSHPENQNDDQKIQNEKRKSYRERRRSRSEHRKSLAENPKNLIRNQNSNDGNPSPDNRNGSRDSKLTAGEGADSDNPKNHHNHQNNRHDNGISVRVSQSSGDGQKQDYGYIFSDLPSRNQNKPNIHPDVLSVAFRGCLAAIKWKDFELLSRLVDYIKHNEDALKEVFHIICGIEKEIIFKYLEFFIPFLSQNNVQNCLHTAIIQHNIDLIRALCEISIKHPEYIDLNQRNDDDKTPVTEALSWKCYDALEILIKSGCDAKNCLSEMRTFSFNTLFPWDSVYGRMDSPMLRSLKCLLESGVDLEIKDKGGSTLMETAVYLINFAVVNYLLKKNFRVTSKCLDIIHKYYFPLDPPLRYGSKSFCKIYIIAAVSKASGDMSIRDKLELFPIPYRDRHGYKKAANDMITALKSRRRLASLQELCRIKIRFQYGVSMMRNLERLNIPEKIQKFLKFEDITKIS